MTGRRTSTTILTTNLFNHQPGTTIYKRASRFVNILTPRLSYGTMGKTISEVKMSEEKPKKKKNPNHYVDNAEFYDALCEWKARVVEAEESGDQKPPITDYIGDCFLKMAEGLSRRACFINYDFREEMVGDAIENCILYAHNFSPTKSKNPFAYFTQMMYYAFLRRIQKEKKQMFIKYKVAEQSDDFSNFLRWSDEDPHEKLSLQKVFNVTDNDLEKFKTKTSSKKKVAKKKTSKKKASKKKSSGATLDSFIE
jgi:hypothetical protein